MCLMNCASCFPPLARLRMRNCPSMHNGPLEPFIVTLTSRCGDNNDCCRTTLGSRPGNAFADVVFGYLWAKISTQASNAHWSRPWLVWVRAPWSIPHLVPVQWSAFRELVPYALLVWWFMHLHKQWHALHPTTEGCHDLQSPFGSLQGSWHEPQPQQR